MNLNVIGISFQVDCESTEPSRFYNAVKSAKLVFDEASEIGFDIKLLDVGGGFPSTDMEDFNFDIVARKLSLGISEFFPSESGVKVIAQPGRYLVASAYTLLSKITSVKEEAEGNQRVVYHLNDGVYGTLSCILTDMMYPTPYCIQGYDEADLIQCCVRGPTDDDLDCISSSIMLPKLSQGDWLCFDNMGAHAIPTSSRLNGFKSTSIHYMCQRSLMDYMTVTESLISCMQSMQQPCASYVIPVVPTVC
jgi:ornithine decarboxylase